VGPSLRGAPGLPAFHEGSSEGSRGSAVPLCPKRLPLSLLGGQSFRVAFSHLFRSEEMKRTGNFSFGKGDKVGRAIEGVPTLINCLQPVGCSLK